MSLRKAINGKCKDCIHDELEPGTWRQQVAACNNAECTLFPVRPVPVGYTTDEQGLVILKAKRAIPALLMLLLVACGDNAELEPITWGEATVQLAEAICQGRVECGGITIGEYGECAIEVRNFLCAYDNNCETLIEPALIEAVDACTEAIPAFNCTVLEAGWLPNECASFFEFQPEAVEVDVAGGNGNAGGSRGRGRNRE